MSDRQGLHASESRADGGGQQLDIRLLGGFNVSTPARGAIILPGARQRTLLAYLVLHRDRPVDRRHLAFLLWPDSAEAQALTNLRQLIHDVRAAVPDSARFIDAGRQLVRWVADAPFALDVDRFEAAVGSVLQQKSSLRPEDSIATLAAGIAVYAGDLLPECYDDWIEPVRRRLREQLVRALRRIVALLEERRAFATAIGHAERLRELEPLDETITLALMRLYAAQGRRALALDAYARIEALLQQELGTAPEPALHELRDRLLRAPGGDEPAPPAAAAEPAFINRAAEWTQLTRAWEAAIRTRPRCVLASGVPGIGKTRLCAEFAALARRQGATVAVSSCYRTVGSLPYAPVVDWLRSPMLTGPVAGMPVEWRAELHGLLPDLAVESAATTAASSAASRRRLFDALVQAISAAPPPRLLVLDDIQWADRETLEWIRFLLSADEPRSLVLLATMRAGERAVDDRLEDVLRDLRREGRLDVIELEALDAPDTAALAAAAGEGPLDAPAAEALFRETEGHPLYIVEMTRASAEGYAGPAAQTTAKRVLPDRVMATIEGRLALLTRTTLDVLGLASVIGREFSAELLAASSGAEWTEVAAAMDELVERRLVGERGSGIYDFSHDSIREVTYTRLGADRRRLLHRDIAQAQIASAGNGPASASAIAKHLERGGFIDGAIPFYRLAAEYALGVFAGSEAVAHYEQALSLVGRLPPSARNLSQEIELRTALCVALVNLEMFSGPRMLQEYARLSALCERAGVLPGPPALRTLAIALLMGGEVAEATRIGQRLQAAVSAYGDPLLVAEAHYVLGVTAHWRGEPATAALHLRAALAASRPDQAGEHVKTYGQDVGVICGVRLAIVLCLLDQPDAARQSLADALARAETLGHPHTLAYARQFGAWALIELGDEATARKEVEGAMQLAEAHGLSGWPIRNAALLGYLVGREGDLDRGISLMRGAAEQWAARGWRLIVPYDRSLLARLCLTASRETEALSAIEEGLTVARETDQPFWTPELLRLKGEVLEASGAPPEVSGRALSEALETARAQGATALIRRAEASLQARRNAGRTHDK